MTQTHRDIPFGDGVYRFQLKMAQILAIEEKTGHRIAVVRRHLLQGWYAKDEVAFGYVLEGDYGFHEVIEVCRQGLIGGGSGFVDGREIEVKDHLANHLVRTYLEPDAGNPLDKAWELAVIVIQACLKGYDPAAEAQKKTESETGTTTPTDASTEDKSSGTAS